MSTGKEEKMGHSKGGGESKNLRQMEDDSPAPDSLTSFNVLMLINLVL